MIRLSSLVKQHKICRTYRTLADRYGYRTSIRRSSVELPSVEQLAAQRDRPQLERLVSAYRAHGHRVARLNPLADYSSCATPVLGELERSRYGLSESDTIDLTNILAANAAIGVVNIESLESMLEKIYCDTLALEFDYVRSRSESEYFWLAEEFEKLNANAGFDSLEMSEHVRLARLMLESQAFDNFLATKFPTTKRYGGEGAESMLVFIDTLINSAAADSISEVLIGMPHRGRLNLLINMLQYSPAVMFRKIKGLPEYNSRYNDVMCGDVLSHLFTAVDLEVPLSYGDVSTRQGNGNNIRVSLLPNPSHLEAIMPVTIGKSRAKMQRRQLGDYGTNDTDRPGDGIMCLQMHGDASFVGQGIVSETVQQAGECPHFSVGGGVHLVVNNQIGYTTQGDCARSSARCTDVAKSVNAPCLHVNGSDTAAVVRAARLAVAYRNTFRRDIFVNLVCFRKHGHNEMDDPTQTQPSLYRIVQARQSIPNEYAKKLIDANVCSKEDLSITRFAKSLNEGFAKADSVDPEDTQFKGPWEGLGPASISQVTTWHTGTDLDMLKSVGEKVLNVKEDFKLHPTLSKRVFPKRLEAIQSGSNIDWPTAEMLAVGSLLKQGFNVRLVGQDVQRGTFAQRHWGLTDHETDGLHVLMNDLESDQKGFLEVANSPLNELTAMGYEYGFSIASPKTLCVWEAQFGDFFNGAQIVIDTFVTSGEAKWMHQSGLMLLLPHGIDGAGPEHSSCRMERFLQLTDSREGGPIGDSDHVNFNVVFPTTPAQYFHLLRLQMARNFRKPVVAIGPKMLLTHRAALSSLDEMGPGTHFKPVLDDPISSAGDKKKVTKLVLVTGKHYYALDEFASQAGDVRKTTAIIRLERLCPFPANEINEIVSKYPNALGNIVWSQEEHQNSGAWSFVQPRLKNFCGIENVRYVGRAPLACPATGCGVHHKIGISEVLKSTFQ